MAGSGPTGEAGSWATPQPPSTCETRSDGFGISALARDLAFSTDEIAAIVGIAPQKLKGKTRTLKAIQAFNGLGRPPILGRHGLLVFRSVPRTTKPERRYKKLDP